MGGVPGEDVAEIGVAVGDEGDVEFGGCGGVVLESRRCSGGGAGLVGSGLRCHFSGARGGGRSGNGEWGRRKGGG